MRELIQALEIFLKYLGDKPYPTHCEHDVLLVLVSPSDVTEEDKKTLEKLHFYSDSVEFEDCFYSFYYGNA